MLEAENEGVSKISAVHANGEPARPMDRRLVLTVAAALVVLALDALTPVGLAVWLLQVILVWIATFWANSRQLPALAALCATFTALGFWLSPRSEPVTWIDQCNVLLSLGAVSALTHGGLRQRAAEDGRRKAEDEAAQARESVRVLRGLLPICAWCKRIRDEAGNWEQLEFYISNHSHAEFTHGICRECAVRLDSGPTIP